MKTILTIIIVATSILSYSQNNKFKAQIFIEDTSLVAGGLIIFPLTKDTFQIKTSDTAIVDLNPIKNRVFYFLWFGWKSKIFRFKTNNTSSIIHKVIVPDTGYYRKFCEQQTCPICLQSKYLLPIKYGMPTPKMLKQANQGQFRLGGCITGIENPKYYCKKDDFEF